jgi:signal transduction histidine kinase
LDKLETDGRFKHYQYDPANPGSLMVGEGVRAICEDHSGVLWIGTQGGGLHKFDHVNETFKPYRHNPSDPNSLSSNNIYTTCETIRDGKQVLWIGTFDGGLNKFDAAAETFKSYRHDPSNPGTISLNFVVCCYSSAHVPGLEHILWIGTAGGGLNKFDTRNETFSHFTEKHGLLDLTVYGILCDSQHNLWMSTNKGIAKFNIRSGGFRHYLASDGLMGREFNGGAYYKNKKGEMFFGGVHGLNIFHPAAIYVNQQVPPIVVTVSKNFEEVPIIDASSEDRSIELSRDTHVISFEFAALDFLSPLQNQYAYKLEPLDKNWIYCGNRRTVNYTHLEPGRYVFRVKGSNNDNLWNEKGVSVKLRMSPALWQTWWFKLLLGFAAVILLFSLYRVRLIARQRKILQRQVEERTREFKEASEKAREMALRAKQASESKSRFLANMSHEIRTPMAGIIGLTDLVLAAPLPDEQQQHLSLVKQSANHLMGILDDILDISKIEAGQLNLSPVDFNLHEAMEEVRDIVRQQVKDKGLGFDWFIQNSIPGEVTGDRSRLKQILLNLISNAVKFTDKGKIGVHIQQENETDTLRFSVSDTGIGIPLPRRPYVFESFAQADDSISRKYGGAGLGLAISRQLVEAMGGRLWFEDNPAGGTVFHFTVPLLVRQSRPHMVEKEKIEEKKEQKGLENESATHQLVSRLSGLNGSVRLLLAEDNPINQKLAQALIKRTGIPLDTVGDGVAALEALKQKKYHLILMDIQMPEMDGLIATGKIRDEMGMKDIPIIAITAHAMKEDRQKCLASGMNDYVTKPFKPNDLYNVLLKWL